MGNKHSGTHHPTYSGKGTLAAILNLLPKHYVDSLNTDSLEHFAIEGILNHLDPHTVYIPTNELQAMNDALNGQFFGLGLSYYFWHDTMHVANVFPGSPAERLKLVLGDQLISIENESLTGETKAGEVLKKYLLREQAQTIQLTVKHPDGEYQTYRVLPELIERSTIPSAFMLDSVCGYIRIETFSEPTAQAFHEALKTLQKAGLKQLIIDLRDNPGGYMDAVARIADELIAGRDTLFYTRNQFQREAIMAEENGLFEHGDLCILIDRESASASEILAGIVQDYDRGMVIGEASFGKGLVQEQFDLPAGDAIRITTARYYLPSGRSIQRNYQYINRTDYFNWVEPENTQREYGKAFYTRRQKRLVEGGRGIVPDIRVTPGDGLLEFPENLFYRHWVQQAYYLKGGHWPHYTQLSDMQAHAQCPNTWLQQLAQDAKQLPDSEQFWYVNNTQYNQQLLLSEWAFCLFGEAGQIAFSWPHNPILNKAYTWLQQRRKTVLK